jgi:hypothetical protein
MELTAFKTMPDELIRHIMEYARPTYPYMVELDLLGENYNADWVYYDSNSPNEDDEITNMRITKYKRSQGHKEQFIFYKLFGEYDDRRAEAFGAVQAERIMNLIDEVFYDGREARWLANKNKENVSSVFLEQINEWN